MTRLLTLAVVGMLFLAVHVPYAAAAEDPRQAQVDALFAGWNEPQSPGCAIGVMSQGKLIYAKGYGMADVTRDIPLSPDTLFDIASMTKQFTAATIGLLILDHKLAPTDDVRSRFPELHIDAPVTVDNLLHHTSGLRDYAELNQLRGAEATDNAGVIALLARMHSLAFAPGSRYSYSNSDYVLLAELIQRTTGKSLGALSHELIFAPLDMRSTLYGGSVKEDPTGLAMSYVPSAPGKYTAVPRDTQTVGDGNLLTTVRDLARWDENFYVHTIGGAALIRMMRTPGALASGRPVPYGFGLMFDEYRGLPTEHHGGSYHGFRTELLRFPQQHFSASVLCNAATANASGLADQIADIYLAQVLQPRTTLAMGAVTVKVAPQVFDTYAGAYLVDDNGERGLVFVGRRGDQFFASPFGELPVELLPLSETEFYMKSTGTRFVFERGKGGAVTQVTLHPATGNIVARKIVVAAPPVELLHAIVGEYYNQDLGAEMRLEILGGGQLILDNGHGGRAPLVPVSNDTFMLPGGPTLTVDRDIGGKITGLMYTSVRAGEIPFVRRNPSP